MYFLRNISDIIKRNKFLFIGLLLVFVYFIPYLILQKQSYFQIHDNLDGAFTQTMLVSKYCKPTSSLDVIPQIMNGIPNECLPSYLNFTVILFTFLPPLQAYLCNDFIIRMLAFLGMFLLLKTYFINRIRYSNLIIYGVSFCFMIVPYYSLTGLTVAGQPLLLYVFLNLIHHKKTFLNYIYILIFPLYSSFVLCGFFICFCLGIFLILDIIKNKKVNIELLTGMVLLAFTYIIIEHKLFLSFFVDSTFISHRTEWMISNTSLFYKFSSTINLILCTQYHSGSFYTLPIIFTFLLVITNKRNISLPVKYLLIILIIIYSIYFMYFYLCEWNIQKGSLLIIFQWNRFYFFLPLLWILLFASCLNEINFNRYSFVVIILCLVVQLFSILIYDGNYKKNIRKLAGFDIKQPNFTQYFAEEQFNKISRFINKDKKNFNVVSIGIFPNVAEYNGFYTLDSYQSNYPLEYKHTFRKIIEEELMKDLTLKKYFDNWGSRCYIFSSELGNDFTTIKDSTFIIKHLNINTNILKKLNCQYLFSQYKINNSDSIGIHLDGTFRCQNSWWSIYLYSIK